MSSSGSGIAGELKLETYKVSSQTPKSWPAMNRGSKPLGCGAFGCVYATADKGVVVKVTRDKREADFASLALRWRKAGNELPPGIVSYHAAADLGGAWALWRDSVGKPKGFWGEEPEMKEYGSPDAKPAVLWLYVYKAAAQGLRSALQNLIDRQYSPVGIRRSAPGSDAAMAEAMKFATLDPAAEQLMFTITGAAWTLSAAAIGGRGAALDATTGKELTREAKAAFQLCRIAAANIGVYGTSKEAVLADALLWLWSQGIVLTDPHSGNVGAHRSTGAPVIFDGWNGTAIEPEPGSFAYGGQSVAISPISRLTGEEWVP